MNAKNIYICNIQRNHIILVKRFKMRRIVLLLSLLTSFVVLNAQSRNKKSEYESIKNDTTYYYGVTSELTSENQAYDEAVEDLYKNIAQNCEPNAIMVGEVELKKHIIDIVTTFEAPIKQKSKVVAVEENFEDDEYSYMVYISKKDFRDMCAERQASVQTLVTRGFKSEDEDNYQLEDALKSYYWAMMLCVAHPYGKTLKVNVDDEDVVAYDWLIERVDGSNGILKSISVVVPKENAIQETDDGLLVNLNVRSTTGLPITNLQLQYNNGNKRMPTSVENGKTTILLNKDTKPKINLRVEYEFELESITKPDVNMVLKKFDEIPLKNYKKNIDLTAHMNNVVKEEEIQPGDFEKSSKLESTDINNMRRKIDAKFQVKDPEYLAIMQEIEKAFRDKNYASVKHYFTDEAYGMVDTLTRYGKMMVVGQQDYSFIKFGNQIICRDINMRFDFRNHVSFNRDVVFRFNYDTKKVESIAFRLSSVTEKDIVTRTKWSAEARLVLINFLEDYQTAYALKRYDYLEAIYSDDALIIVGHVVNKTVIPDRAEFNLPAHEVKLMTYDKDTYFKNLSRTFKLQEYINLRFADTEFTRATPNNREVYGVRLLQEYYSSTYGDVGYLFLLVDLTEEDKPLIHVRAWQPDKVELEKLMDMKDLRL